MTIRTGNGLTAAQGFCSGGTAPRKHAGHKGTIFVEVEAKPLLQPAHQIGGIAGPGEVVIIDDDLMTHMMDILACLHLDAPRRLSEEVILEENTSPADVHGRRGMIHEQQIRNLAEQAAAAVPVP